MRPDARAIRFDPATHRCWSGMRELVSVTTVQGDAVVVDLKTGTVPPWAPLQLVGYARLDLDDQRGLRRRRLVVQLLPTGRYTVREYPLVNFGRDERVFLAALAVAQWKRGAPES